MNKLIELLKTWWLRQKALKLLDRFHKAYKFPSHFHDAGPVHPNPTGMICGRCYAQVNELFDAPCQEKPEDLKGQPLGMYHCPDCGAMVLAGVAHPQLCELCRDLKHPGYDEVTK